MRRILLVLVLLVASVAVCSAETAKDAVRALKKLEARCQAGISYRDYAPALGEAKFEVNMFLEGEEAKSTGELKTSIAKTMTHYLYLQKLWSRKNSEFKYNMFMLDKDPYGTMAEYFKLYPTAKSPKTGGGILSKNGEFVYFSEAFSFVLNEASKELKISTSHIAAGK